MNILFLPERFCCVGDCPLTLFYKCPWCAAGIPDSVPISIINWLKVALLLWAAIRNLGMLCRADVGFSRLILVPRQCCSLSPGVRCITGGVESPVTGGGVGCRE